MYVSYNPKTNRPFDNSVHPLLRMIQQPMASNNTTEFDLTESHYQRHCSSLMGAALESWVHELLYMRNVYTTTSFTTATFLGVRCHVSRHPGVVSYISNALKVAVPAIVSGAADEISLLIVDGDATSSSVEGVDPPQAGSEIVEAYSLRFTGMTLSIASSTENTAIDEDTTAVLMPLSLRELEREMRDLVLATQSLEKENGVVSDSLTFKLVVHIPTKDKTCSALNEAFATGAWFVAGDDKQAGNGRPSSPSRGRVIRPLHHCINKSLGSILFSVVKTDSGRSNRKRPQPTRRANEKEVVMDVGSAE
jgi:hypothetical protein